ncbi:MAG: WG repeat-containing protein [Bacteroidia bacterium]|nr:WG repeat-containing protein [Bacteroidia bacterium]
MRFIPALTLCISALIMPSVSNAQADAKKTSGSEVNSSTLRFDKCDSHWGVLDPDGNVICDYVAHIYPVHAEKTRFYNGLALVKRDVGSNEMSYMFADGQHLTDFDVLGYAREFNEGYTAYRKKSNMKFGIINYKNEVILPFEYSDITSICRKRAFVKNNQNLWALYDVENKKFITEFVYGWIDYVRKDEYNLVFYREVVVENQSKVKLIVNVDNGQTRDYNTATTRIPNKNGFYMTLIGKYKLWESMENTRIRFKTYADSAYFPDKYLHPNLIEAKFAGKYCFLDSNGTRISPLYYQIEWDDPNLRPNQESTPRYVKVVEDKKGKSLQGIFDVVANKEVISPQYDLIYLHYSAPVMFKALKGGTHFLLDSAGTNRLTEYISFNSIPYYINKAADVCIAAEINPILPNWRVYYLYRSNGEKILNEGFLNYTVTGSQISVFDAQNPAAFATYDMNTKQLKGRSNTAQEAEAKVVFKSMNNSKVYYTGYYEMQDKDGRKIIKEPVISYTSIGRSMYILKILDDGLKTGIYDIEKRSWVSVTLDGAVVDFSPSDKVVRLMMPGVVAFGLRGSTLKLWRLSDNTCPAGLDIIEQGEWSCGLLPVKNASGKCGYIDSTFTLVIPAIYEMTYTFHYGCGGVQIMKDNRKYYGFINPKGEWIIGDEQFTERTLNGCSSPRVSDMQCYIESIKTASLNKTVYTPLSNGRMGLNTYFDWSKYHDQQNAGKVKYDPKCKVCNGSGSYIFRESCGECGGEGYNYGDVETKVIRSGGAKTVYQNGGNIQMTVYEEPVVSQSRSRTKCGTCNGTGNDPQSFQFKDCWKCRRK